MTENVLEKKWKKVVRVTALTLLTLTPIVLMAPEITLRQLRQVPVAPPTYNPKLLYISSYGTSPNGDKPKQEEPKQEAPAVAVGDRNIAEFFLEDLVKSFQRRRQEKSKNDPSYADRINPESLLSDRVNLLLLGTDETRERFDQFNGRGWGRADVILFVSFDPHSFKTVALSFPRDLFVPGLKALQLPDAKINTLPLLTQVDPSADTLGTAARVIEDATQLPVDGVVLINLDFANGYKDINTRFHPGIFDTLFPEGLKLFIPEEINDPAYPVGYGTKRMHFLPGEQVLDGASAVAYARTRIDFDFGRNDRQRAVAEASARRLLQMVREDIFWGQNATLDTLASFLRNQTHEGNIFYNISVPELVTSVRRHLADLRSHPRGLLALAALALNTPELDDNSFQSLGLSRANGMVENVQSGEPLFTPNMLKLTGTKTTVLPNQYGNYPDYWRPLHKTLQKIYP